MQARHVLTEEQWEKEAMLKLRAEIDRIDALAAATAAATSEEKYAMIDGALYVKAWLVGDETQSDEEGTYSQA